MAGLVALPSWEYRGETFLPGEWWEGLILAESAGNPSATRYEPHQDRIPDGDAPLQDDGRHEDDKSYGLVQLMGYNARTLCGVPAGTRMDFQWLLLPLVNLALGLRLLVGELAATEGDVPRALSRYNGGPTGTSLVPGPDGSLVMRRQEYVDRVAQHARAVVRDRAA